MDIIAGTSLFNCLKVMHSFTYNLLPLSFNQLWISKRKCLPLTPQNLCIASLITCAYIFSSVVDIKEGLSPFNSLKFIHSFTHNLLPLSFHQLWISKWEHLPDCEFCDIDQLHIPAHKFVTLFPEYRYSTFPDCGTLEVRKNITIFSLII